MASQIGDLLPTDVPPTPSTYTETRQKYYENHKTEQMERNNKWRQENPEHMRAYRKAYYEAHKDTILARKRAKRLAEFHRGLQPLI